MLLSGCIVVPVGSNAAPGFAQHVAASSDDNVLLLLVLQTGRVRMSQLGIGGSDLRFEPPAFMPERELASASLSRTKWGFCFGIGTGGGCGLAVNDRVVEACVMWPDGRVISLSSPREERWGRVVRGYMPDGWREQWLVDLPQSPVLYGHSTICPSAEMASLNWNAEQRKQVSGYLARMQARPGIDGGFVTVYPPAAAPQNGSIAGAGAPSETQPPGITPR